MKRCLLLILFCFSILGCGDEGIESVLDPQAAAFAPAAVGTIGPVPPEIQKLLWGDEDLLISQLQDVLDDGVFTDERGREIHDLHGVSCNSFIDDLCLIREQKAHYIKYIDAAGIPIMAGTRINDRFLYAGQHIILTMTSKRPEIREHLQPDSRLGKGFHPTNTPLRRFRVMFFDPFVGAAELPEVKTHRGGRIPVSWCGDQQCVIRVQMSPVTGEEDRLSIQSTFIHEFAHAIHFVMPDLDPTFQGRLEAAYAEAKEKGTFKINLSRGVAEFWAEGAEIWFNEVAVETILDPADGTTWKDIFLEKHPLLYALLDEWFPLTYLGSVDWEF